LSDRLGDLVLVTPDDAGHLLALAEEDDGRDFLDAVQASFRTAFFAVGSAEEAHAGILLGKRIKERADVDAGRRVRLVKINNNKVPWVVPENPMQLAVPEPSRHGQ
jgi:hypothetical protein